MARKTKPPPKPSLIDSAAQQADDYIMDLCGPGKMDPEEAVVFLERVCGRCEAAIEALREEHQLE